MYACVSDQSDPDEALLLLFEGMRAIVRGRSQASTGLAAECAPTEASHVGALPDALREQTADAQDLLAVFRTDVRE